MDLDSFLAAPKWDILKIISENPSSPIEISEITKTTVSYVSQQLKLLEAGGIVKKVKTGAYEKGKPRNIYSIKEEFAFITLLTNGYSEKKKVEIDDHKRILFKIWTLENNFFHIPLEKFFILIDDLLSDIDSIYLKKLNSKIELEIYSNKKGIDSEINQSIKKNIPLVNFIVKNSINQNKISENQFLLYENIMLKRERNKELKGGDE